MDDHSSWSGGAVLGDLIARGLVHDTTDPDLLRARLEDGPITVYCGFDPTAESLHVGNLVPLLLLRRFQLFGHRPIALAGGATGMIGDPGGRSEERNLLDQATLDRNVMAIKHQLEQFLDFTPGPNQALLVDNREWTAPMGVLDFLRDVGKYVTVNTMLAKESIRARVASEHGISFTEFSYMLLQANDFHWLYKHLNCEMQVGGSDQWGNITAGVDLIRRKEGVSVHALTVPLITKADGTKFGKTAAGAVWLDPDRTSPYDFFQYFVRCDDRDVERFLKQLTLLSLEEIAGIMARHEERPEERFAQRRLAREVTELVHGPVAASEAEHASSGFTRAVADLAPSELEALVDAMPTAHLARGDVLGVDVVELVARIGLVGSKGEGRRLIAQAGLYMNDEALPESRPLGPADVLHDRFVMLRRGKKQRYLVVIDDEEPGSGS
ncbi:tyrosine--tRNA ligase [Rhabdothermincola sp.]|uniref:tyrosine--tRNA ligase n=1 Tax=Rhabdothermincola sp. TaxID=2820405 RepID=UPI002FE30295